MSNGVKSLITSIREHEAAQAVAKKQNEKVLPIVQSLLVNLDSFNFGKEDMDLKKRLESVAEKLLSFSVDDISRDTLEECRKESAAVLSELEVRYRTRLEAYATRQNIN